MKYIIFFIIFLSLAPKAGAVMPTSLLYADLEKNYNEDVLFSTENDPETKNDCRVLAKLARDITIIKLIKGEGKGAEKAGTDYVANGISYVAAEKRTAYVDYAAAIDNILNKTVLIYWRNTSWAVDFVDIVHSFIYNRCISHLEIKHGKEGDK
jgi:hypothetical protein